MLEREPGSMSLTDFGWALESVTPPDRFDIFWVHLPTKDVYTHDGDGWYRIRPNDRKRWDS